MQFKSEILFWSDVYKQLFLQFKDYKISRKETCFWMVATFLPAHTRYTLEETQEMFQLLTIQTTTDL